MSDPFDLIFLANFYFFISTFLLITVFGQKSSITSLQEYLFCFHRDFTVLVRIFFFMTYVDDHTLFWLSFVFVIILIGYLIFL